MFKALKKESSKYVVSGLFRTAIQLLSGIIVYQWLLPEELGAWQSIMVYTVYISFFTFGTVNAVTREVPVQFGKGQLQEAEVNLQVGETYILVLGIITIIAGSLLGFFYLFYLESLTTGLYILAATMIAAVGLYSSFLNIALMVHEQFNKLSIILMFESTIVLLGIGVVYFYGIEGYVFNLLMVALFKLAFLYFYKPFNSKLKWNKPAITSLITIGFPIYIWNSINVYMRNSPKLFLSVMGLNRELGLISPGWTVLGATKVLPTYINSYMFPRIAREYGAGSLNKKYIVKQLIALFTLVFGITILIFFTLPYVFDVFFEKYTEGLRSAQIFIFCLPFFSVNGIMQNILIIIKKMKIFRLSTIFAFVGMIFVFGYCYLTEAFYLEGVALSLVVGEIIVFCINIVFVFQWRLKE
jgi:O-antigen/teichoic acid export membrane protein